MQDGVEVTFRRGNQVKFVTVWCQGMQTRQCAYRGLLASKATLAIRERGFRESSFRPIGGTISS